MSARVWHDDGDGVLRVRIACVVAHARRARHRFIDGGSRRSPRDALMRSGFVVVADELSHGASPLSIANTPSRRRFAGYEGAQDDRW